jgi:hypothetical protein
MHKCNKTNMKLLQNATRQRGQQCKNLQMCQGNKITSTVTSGLKLEMSVTNLTYTRSKETVIYKLI